MTEPAGTRPAVERVTPPLLLVRAANPVPSVLTNSGWRVNFRGGADIEVTMAGRRRPARATLVEDPATVAATYQAMVDRLGWRAAQRRLGIRINVGRAPTREELIEAVRSSGLSIVRLELR